MKQIVLLFLLFNLHRHLAAQCSVDIDSSEFQPICYTWWGMYATELAPWAIEEPGWTYSWSPATGLDDPNILHPLANPSTTTTYTLTVTAPGCGTFIGGTYRVEVMPNTPSITPAGPISHHYSDTSSLVLTSNAPYGGWYKNGTLVQGCCNPNYTVSFNPTSSSYTDYYRYYSSYSCNHWSNIIEVTYIGCSLCKITILPGDAGSSASDDERIKAIRDLESISVFPNPVSSRLTISSKNQVTGAEVTNAAGGIVKKINFNGTNPYSFDVSDLASGYYICTIKMPNGIKQLPFIVRK